ncbi:MAG: 50S ribosomal protein L35 [Candidatus Saccharimonadales bacterium]|jgi:ribosomal protein L35
MPKIKLKTRKSIAKRIKLSSSKKMLRGSAYMSHFLAKKSGANKRRKSGDVGVDSTNQKTVKKALGL